MSKEQIEKAIDNSYKYTSAGFLIDHDILADKILALSQPTTDLDDLQKPVESDAAELNRQINGLQNNLDQMDIYNRKLAKEYSDLFDRLKALRAKNDELKELLRMSRNYLSNTNCKDAIDKLIDGECKCEKTGESLCPPFEDCPMRKPPIQTK